MSRSSFRVVGAAAAALWLSSCVDELPRQDLRILSATPVARLSADLLWKDYASDADAANQRYFGKAVVVTGTVTSHGAASPDDQFVLFGQTSEHGVRASLLDEQAGAILERATDQSRLTLKCFCEGLNGHVILRSCIVP